MHDRDELQKGDWVKIRGQEQVGEVIAVKGNKVTIALEHITITLPLAQVERIRLSTTAQHPIPMSPTGVINLSAKEFSTFQPEIDLHGMYVEEALKAVDKWIDQASLLGHKHLKVIHGRGMGILRRAIRAYLQSHVLVKKVIQQHPLRGADGVTLVELL